VDFAVVVMTPDDLGKATDASDLTPRARQNVVFELGFFIGALGPDRVAAILKGDVERPSDFDGVVYISLDKEDWRSASSSGSQAGSEGQKKSASCASPQSCHSVNSWCRLGISVSEPRRVANFRITSGSPCTR
jgi:hypothetical protein